MSGRKGRGLMPPTDYEVAYGEPPVAARFRTGQSGKSKGCPKGARNKRPGLHEEGMKDILLKEAYCGSTVRDGDRNLKIPMAQAVIRSTAVNAAKGQHRAQQRLGALSRLRRV